jgi:hypothetical protein
MQLAIAFEGSLHGFRNGRVGGEFVVGDERVDAGNVHAHNAACADIQMADFAVAHLAVWQADEMFASANEGVGIFREELVVGGLAGQRDSVVCCVRAVTPSVEDG